MDLAERWGRATGIVLPPGASHEGGIICGDALEVMRAMPAGSVGMVVTSPPYNLLNTCSAGAKAGKKGGLNRSRWRGNKLQHGYAAYGDDMPAGEYDEWQRECLGEMLRVVKDDGVVFYNHKWRVQNGLMQDRAAIVSGFPVRQVIIWKRPGGLNFNDGYFLPTYEVIYMIAKPGFRLREGANRCGDVWHFNEERNSGHPAPFPVQIPARCIESTNDNGAVLDPFMGSGTTGVAAKQAGRAWLGIELSEEYCGMARARIAAAPEFALV